MAIKTLKFQDIKDAMHISPQELVEDSDIDPFKVPFGVWFHDEDREGYIKSFNNFELTSGPKEEAISYPAFYEFIMSLDKKQLKKQVLLDGKPVHFANYAGEWVVLVVSPSVEKEEEK